MSPLSQLLSASVRLYDFLAGPVSLSSPLSLSGGGQTDSPCGLWRCLIALPTRTRKPAVSFLLLQLLLLRRLLPADLSTAPLSLAECSADPRTQLTVTTPVRALALTFEIPPTRSWPARGRPPPPLVLRRPVLAPRTRKPAPKLAPARRISRPCPAS